MFLLDGVRRGQGTENFSGDEHGVFGMLDLRKENHEFIAAMAADGVGTAHAGEDAAGNGLQQLVADGMAPGIVDFFKVVEIHKHYRQLFVISSGKRNGLVDAVVEQQTIGKVGQDIVLRQM